MEKLLATTMERDKGLSLYETLDGKKAATQDARQTAKKEITGKMK